MILLAIHRQGINREALRVVNMVAAHLGTLDKIEILPQRQRLVSEAPAAKSPIARQSWSTRRSNKSRKKNLRSKGPVN